MAYGDPNAIANPGLQYSPDGTPILTIPPSNQPPVAGVDGGLNAAAANNNTSGMLNSPTRGALTNTQAATNQRRNMVPGAIQMPQMPQMLQMLQMPQMPNYNIGMNDMLIRAGGAGMEGAQTSGLQSYANMAKEYGNVRDLNISNSMDAYLAQIKALEAQTDALENLPKTPQPSPYMQAAVDAIEQIEANVAMAESNNNPLDNVTGFMGNALSFWAGTPAHDTKMAIETVVSSIGFDRLQKMRDDSPTGGALGQVSETELAQLNASLGNLRQSQSREQFKANLALVKKHYLSSVRAIEAQQQAYAAMNGVAAPVGTMSPAMSPNVSAADAIVGVTN